MFKHEKLYVCNDVEDRDALCKRLTDNGATLVSTVGEQDSIHIFNSFQGAIFEECLKKGCRIIGLPCLQETLQSGKALPRTPYPVYSRVMEGIVVSSDVVEQKAKLKSYVHQMNGIWADELSGDTQYFITNEPGSIHYLWALEYGSNIVQPSWITESWENRALSNPKSHILPPLHGCVISVTGLSTGTRNTIQNLVLHYGGKYSQQLSRKVTHLLCDKPTGRKYVTALAWGIHIVNSNWLYDSINAKGMVDVSRYEVPPDAETSMEGGGGGGGGGGTLYLRSPYSRSGPYSTTSLSSAARSRLGAHVGAPILIRRRAPVGANYTSLFSLPSTNPHQFAQTTQFQGSHHSLPLSHSSLRQATLSQSKPSSSRSREKEVGRSSMDKYRDMFDQITGLLRMCDDIIEKSTTIQTSNLNDLNFSDLLSSNISSITNLYNNLLCNNNNNNTNNNNNNKNILDTFKLPNSAPFTTNNTTTTTTTTSTTSSNNTSDINNNKDNSSTTTTTTTTTPSTPITNKEENTTDMDMESDDEPITTVTPSEQEK